MTNLNSSDFIRTVDHAAAMSDRWLFVAAFLLLLVLGSAVIFWLVKYLQAVICCSLRHQRGPAPGHQPGPQARS